MTAQITNGRKGAEDLEPKVARPASTWHGRPSASGLCPPIQRRLGISAGPWDALPWFHGQPGLTALVGEWAGGGAIVTSDAVRRAREVTDLDGHPASADELDAMTRHLDDPAGFLGAGWFGTLGYQLGRRFETLPSPPARPHPAPDLQMSYMDHVVRYDRSSGTWWFESLHHNSRCRRIEEHYRRVVEACAGFPLPAADYALGPFTTTPSLARHERTIEEGLEYIRAGEIFQANLCVRMEARFEGDPLDMFCRAGRVLQPAWAAFSQSPGRAVASMSPELFLRRVGQTVTTSPIKGTAPLSTDPSSLAASAKDQAENAMIVDLMRNDLSRVSRAESVQASQAARVEQHTGVWHLIRDITSVLRPGVGDAELLRATFPPGSVTGAPKIRAMEVIHELEATAREVYTGSVGYLQPRRLELNVAIRTFEFAADSVWLGVGGGIVASSKPSAEVRECLVKAEPLLFAVAGNTRAGAINWPRRPKPPEPGAVATSTRVDRRRAVARPGPIARPTGHEPLIMGGSDILETSRGSLFAVDDDGVHTPRLDGRSFPGATRQRVIAVLARAGIPVHERTLRLRDLERATEVFTADTRYGILDAETRVRLQHRTWRRGPFASWLARELEEEPAPRHVRRSASGLRVLLVDNYDSFVFNLARYCEELGARTTVVRNDDDGLRRDRIAGTFDRVVISPGPGSPSGTGRCVPLVRELAGSVPVLGVCLGHQCIGEAFGAETVRAPQPVHGRQSLIHHDGTGIFRGLPPFLAAARYHSLVVNEHTLPDMLAPTARTPSGILMGLRHRRLPIHGIQVHPESILTTRGHELVSNFLTRGALVSESEQLPT